jgi:hypothetical protein
MTNANVARSCKTAIRTAGLGVCLGLLLVSGAAVTLAGETQPATSVTEPAAAQTASPAGPREGLRVHGHWTIEVRNPDGTLVERREFQNALVIPAGANFLANVMGRARTVGGWRIDVFGGVQLCEDPAGGAATSCQITESTDAVISNAAFKTLTVGVSGATPAETVLNGSMVAQRTGDISMVRTFDIYCAPSTSPAACPGGAVTGGDLITSTTLGAPIPVTAGQQVQVRVLISFS